MVVQEFLRRTGPLLWVLLLLGPVAFVSILLGGPGWPSVIPTVDTFSRTRVGQPAIATAVPTRHTVLQHMITGQLNRHTALLPMLNNNLKLHVQQASMGEAGAPWARWAILGAIVTCFGSLALRQLGLAPVAQFHQPAVLSPSAPAVASRGTAPVVIAIAGISATAPLAVGVEGSCFFETCVACACAPGKVRHADTSWRDPLHRQMDCGEDSFMCSPAVLAVADGVGGWTYDGVDPSLFSNALMKGAKRAAEAGLRDPVALLKDAYSSTLEEVLQGSATALVAVLHEDGRLVTASLGDCALLVIRGDKCVHSTKQLLFGFNAPAQLTTDPAMQKQMPPEISLVSEFHTQPEDVVVLSTDGLFDNLYVDEIIQLVTAACCADQHQHVAQLLKEYAVEVAHSTTRLTPFALNARKAGICLSGGKQDDITVVVGRVKRQGP